ncbi:hypothetical protein C1637_21795 [Chryseobacterium lactis]|uniref:DUF3592 domain-containing protein n=1 Tax=Chryseobacterium lactis TaxID=1241981 RepID=A0A3G6RTV9_CHRLC|nr:hypothetical protein [Chryseobacterium lactis]AZA84918.1 hypothetical protein EG342_24755 [Chryseobacterium lactis]AZB05306.1 hypothetical protein EG341_15635 [Chryseobacterium lactis]PNW11455.1 hypothetical protein C1637_21795 [Chryseobacterium lactis]
MKFMIIFWTLYMLVFCIPFPIFLYVMIEDISTEPRNSLAISYVYLGFSILIWLYVLFFMINNLLVKTFKEKNAISNIMQNGIPRDAEITNYKLVKYSPKTKTNMIHITFSFRNLKNTLIQQEMMFYDTKPQEKRFDAGNTIKVLLNPSPSKEPHYILSGSQTKFKVNNLLVRVLFIAFLIAYVIGLYGYFYIRESFDFGWRFLTFMHPIIFSGIMFFLTILIVNYIVGKFVKNKKDEYILFAGRNTKATIISVSQTGLTVNDQPQIMFQVSFKDFRGNEHIAVYKKIISLLHLSSVPKNGSIEVLYDENDPKKIMIPKIF